VNKADDGLERLRRTRGFVFDLDGTLVLGDQLNKGVRPLPGALALTQRLHSQQVPFVILTNGTTRPPQAYGAMLRELGFPIRDEMVLTPAAVAADFLSRHKVRRAMVLGGEGVWRPLQEAGIEVTPPDQKAGSPPQVEAVFVGWFREFTMEHLEAACHAVWAGASLYTASLAPFFATAGGRALGTSRAISAMITSLTGRRARIMGKPSLEALRCAGRRLGMRPVDLAVVGDDPTLEVLMAHRGGSLAIAVQSGIADAAAFANLPPQHSPHLAVRNAEELLQLYEGAPQAA
jgi:HAD superfamily hydrolase (TIGR01450 family)